MNVSNNLIRYISIDKTGLDLIFNLTINDNTYALWFYELRELKDMVEKRLAEVEIILKKHEAEGGKQ